MFNLDAPRHARWRAASPRCARWRSVQRGSRFSRPISIYNGKTVFSHWICNRSKSVGICINHYNSYVDRLSSEKNPVDKSKPPLSGRWWEEMHITTTHTSIAFLQRRRIPSIRVNHNFKKPQIHNATAHITNHPQHMSHWQFEWKTILSHWKCLNSLCILKNARKTRSISPYLSTDQKK